jgi:hypothetical protein
MRGLAGLVWDNPVARVIIVVLLLAGLAVWIWEQIQEAKEGEAMREKDRTKGDSIWKQ